MSQNPKEQQGLRPGFTPLGIWAFSIGTSIGWGSFIVTCNTYLQKSGVLGTAFGMLLGMAVILVITWNLQYMIRTKPDAGGIYTFEKRVGGKDFGFLAAWFVLLTYLAVLWANITSLPLFARSAALPRHGNGILRAVYRMGGAGPRLFPRADPKG